jgi:hypothetical protein
MFRLFNAGTRSKFRDMEEDPIISIDMNYDKNLIYFFYENSPLSEKEIKDRIEKATDKKVKEIVDAKKKKDSGSRLPKDKKLTHYSVYVYKK